MIVNIGKNKNTKQAISTLQTPGVPYKEIRTICLLVATNAGALPFSTCNKNAKDDQELRCMLKQNRIVVGSVDILPLRVT